MSPLDHGRRLFRWSLCLAAGLMPVVVPATATAADPKPAETALDKVPADAEAFSAMLRLGDTIAAIGRSRAWKLLWNESTVQQQWKKAWKSYDDGEGDWAEVKKFLESPANKDLPALALDALSQEMFVYAGDGWSDLLNLFQMIYGAVYYGGIQEQLAGGNGIQNQEQVKRTQARLALKALIDNAKLLRVPDAVIGFKVSDPAKVTAQLKRLDGILADALKETPLKGRSERVKIGEDEFLVLKLDGSLVPWDELPVEKIEDKPKEFDKLFTELKKVKLNVALGVRQGYLLLGIGRSTDHLAKFGGPGPKLSGRAEFKPLAKHAGRPITSVGYTSAKIRETMSTRPQDVQSIVGVIKAALEKGELPEDLTKAIGKDIDALAKIYISGLKTPGAECNFTFRTGRGWETFAYDFTNSGAPEPRPLTLLNHLGGEPLMASVWRSGTTVDDYRALVKWVSIFYKHAEKAAIAKGPNGEQEVKKFHEEALPMLQEFSDVIEKLWLPALEDGQEGFVVDAKLTSKQWHKMIPPSDMPLPMLELGVVLGVSDSAKLEKSLESLRTLGNKMIAKARGEVPAAGVIPEFEIPKPKVVEAGGKTFAHFPIPEEIGLDSQFQPTGGLSKKVAALALSRNHAERLLAERPLQTGSELLADSSRPLHSVFYLNWAGFVDAALPWVAYAKAQGAIPDEEEFEKKIGNAIQLLKVFRSYTSIKYRENGATVTRSEAVFRDIDPPFRK